MKLVNIVELHERIIFAFPILKSWNIIMEFHDGAYMKTNEAILRRIEEICSEKGKNVCKACLSGGKSPSAIYDLMKGRTKCPKVTTVKSFCEGAGITLSEFFDRDYFNDLEDDE